MTPRPAAAPTTTSWREHALQALFVIACALAGLAWSGHERRIDAHEAQLAGADRAVADLRVAGGRTDEQIAGLRRDVQRLESKVDELLRVARGAQ